MKLQHFTSASSVSAYVA